MKKNSILKVSTCLISVSDKTGILKIAKHLSKKNIQIISTGNTYSKLSSAKILAKKVDSVTSFPEILDGRVKTLHPKIFGGILANLDKPSHLKQMKKHNISKIQMVIINLYPFEKVAKKSISMEQCIENIDIGGPSIIRAAAKNYMSTAVLTDKDDYKLVLDEINKLNGISLETRKMLAYKAFSRTMEYDIAISRWYGEKLLGIHNKTFFLIGENPTKLRYGENPHQKAELFINRSYKKGKFYNQLAGKELSYNNFNDLHTGLNLVSEFNEPACVIIKHAIPCGVSEAVNLKNAWKNAYLADELSAFGGVVSFNRQVDAEIAKMLVKIFLEVVAAPSFSKDALNILKRKINLRVLKIRSIKDYANSSKQQITMLSNSFLTQERDQFVCKINNLKLVSKKKPNKKQLADLLFANKVVKYVRSNAIVLAKNKTTVGIGSGNTSRVDSVNFAIKKSTRVKTKQKKSILIGTIMASDAFFPFADSIKIAKKSGITSIIQPGGSINDRKVINEVDNSNISMVFTGKRNFSH